MKAETIAQVVAAEAGYKTATGRALSMDQRLQAMKDIYSAAVNRSRMTGTTVEDVIAGPDQFDSYNKTMPAGTPDLVGLAEKAIAEVDQTGPTHEAEYYATVDKTHNLPSGMSKVMSGVDNHVYFTDPQGRPIKTAAGTITPKATLAPGLAFASYAPETPSPEAAAGMFGGFSLGQPTANAGPAGSAYSDLVAPKSVQTTAISAEKPKGMEALAPNGLIEKYGPNRPNRPHEAILGIADKAVKDVLGQDYSAVATSGMEDAGKDYSGAGRHPTGNAVDAYAVNTRTGEVATHAQMSKVAQQAAALGATGVGFGTGYMDADGISKMHIDTARPNNPASWGALGTRATMNPDERKSIMGGMMLGTPGFNPDQATGGVPVPADDPRKEAVAAAQPDTGLAPGLSPASYNPDQPAETAGMFGAPAGQVERAPLSDLPKSSPSARLAFDAAAAGVPEAPADTQLGAGLYGGVPQPTGLTERESRLAATAPSGDVGWSVENAVGNALGLTPDAPPASSFMARPEHVASNMGMFGAPTAAAPSMSSALTSSAPLGAPTSLGQQTAALQQQQTISPFGTQPAQQPAAQPSTTIASPTETAPTEQNTTFPDAPAPQTRMDNIKSAIGPSLAKAGMGFLTGGPIGAAVGVLGGLLGNKMGGMFGNLGPGFDAGMPSGDRFSTGSGLAGINAAMGGARGAQGFSNSNPGMSYTSLGPGMGGLRRSDKFGWTEHVNDAGSVVGISYDNPNQGGLLGSLSRSVGGMFGGRGGGLSARGRDSVSKGKGGLY